MNTVWAVTQGAYSDYHVVAIMASKELADEYVALHLHNDYYDGYRAEEFDFLDSVPEHIPVLFISERINGNNSEPNERIVNVLVSDNPKNCTHDTYFNKHYNPKTMSLNVKGTDFDRVRKVFSEQRAIALTDPRLI